MTNTSNAEASALMSNPLIAGFTKTNVYLYYAFYSSLSVFFLVQSVLVNSYTQIISGIILGMLCWTFIEYVMHRIFFHWKPRNTFEKIFVFVFHDVHHEYPRDVNRSITPLVFSLPLAIGFYFLFGLIFGKHASAIYPGFILGYLTYTIIHDSTHHFPMNHPILKYLKRHHMHHHYFDKTKNFGVSIPLWDIVFRTYSRN